MDRIDRDAARFVLFDGRTLTFGEAHGYAMAAAWAMNRPELIPPRRLGTRRAFRAYTRAAQALGRRVATIRLQNPMNGRISANDLIA